MVTLGVVVFAGASALCGLTPNGSAAEGWIVAFRVVQGAAGGGLQPSEPGRWRSFSASPAA